MAKRLLMVLAVALLCTTWSAAAIIDFVTTFNPEVPGATGSGQGFFQFDTEAQTLYIDVSWSGLSGVTTVAHIHCCVTVPGEGTVGVAVTPVTLPGFPTGVSSGSYSVLLDLTAAGSYTTGFINNFAGGSLDNAAEALLRETLAGRSYFNIHTNLYPPGEIRGFMAPVPEPGTLLLSALGLAGLAVWRRRATR